ncbi:MAG: hypothetical protein ACK4NC_01165 [Candidatus Gracilibacteria bacterium]
MLPNKQTNTNTESELHKKQLTTEESVKNIFSLPDSPEKTVKIKTLSAAKSAEALKNQKQVEEIAASEEGKKLGLIFGGKALMYMWNTDMYVHNRLLHAKLKNDKKSNEELRQVYLAVGGVLNHVKATGIKVHDLANALPRGIAGIMEKVGYMDQKVSNTLTGSPIMRQHRVRRNRIAKVVSIMKQRGIPVDSIRDFYSKKLHNQDTRSAYKNALNPKEKANNYLSDTLKEDLERVDAIDNFMMKRVVSHEKTIYGSSMFEGKTFKADALTNTIIVRDINQPSTYKRIPYSFDANGYMVFNGEVSLVNALQKQKEILINKSPESQSTLSNLQEQKEKPKNGFEKLSLEQRRIIIERLRKDKQRAFYIDREANKDFIEGKKDNLIIQNGENPTEKKEVHMQSKTEVSPDNSSREVYYADFMDNEEKDQSSKPEPFMMQTETGVTKWSQTAPVKKFLRSFDHRTISNKEAEEAATLLASAAISADKKVVKTFAEEKILSKPYLWSTGPSLQTVKITLDDKVKEVPIVKNEKNELEAIFTPNKNSSQKIFAIPLKNPKEIVAKLQEAA